MTSCGWLIAAPDKRGFGISASCERGEQWRWVMDERSAKPCKALDRVTAPVSDPLCPLVTADGTFMFFIGGAISWTRADFIRELRTH